MKQLGKIIDSKDITNKEYVDNLVSTQIDQLSGEIANKIAKNGITLDKHTDGLIYIFVDGVPIGNGLEINTEVIAGDVTGYLDENNNLLLSGNLADGTYTLKWLEDDGTYSDTGGTVKVGEEVVEEIINLITQAVDSSGQPFNNGQGWKTGYRLGGSDGTEKSASDCEVTGFIPFAYGDTLYMKDVVDDGTHVIAFYAADYSFCVGTNIATAFGGAIDGSVVSRAMTGAVQTQIGNHEDTIAFIRVSANEITSDSIITVNQAIE